MSDEAHLAYAARTRGAEGAAPRDERVAATRAEQQVPADDAHSLKAIVSDLWQHGESLLKAELALGVELGKAELNQQVAKGKIALRHTVIMSGLFYAGYLTMLASLVLGLNAFMPAWLAALSVGIVSAIAGYWMLRHDVKNVSEAVASAQRPSTHHLPVSNTAAHRAQH